MRISEDPESVRKILYMYMFAYTFFWEEVYRFDEIFKVVRDHVEERALEQELLESHLQTPVYKLLTLWGRWGNLMIQHKNWFWKV